MMAPFDVTVPQQQQDGVVPTPLPLSLSLPPLPTCQQNGAFPGMHQQPMNAYGHGMPRQPSAGLPPVNQSHQIPEPSPVNMQNSFSGMPNQGPQGGYSSISSLHSTAHQQQQGGPMHSNVPNGQQMHHNGSQSRAMSQTHMGMPSMPPQLDQMRPSSSGGQYMNSSIGGAMNNSMGNLMNSSMGGSMNNPMGNLMNNNMGGPMNNSMGNLMNNSMGGSMNNSTGMNSSMGGSMGGMGMPMGGSMVNTMGNQMMSQMGGMNNSMGSSIINSMGGMGNSMGNMMGAMGNSMVNTMGSSMVNQMNKSSMNSSTGMAGSSMNQGGGSSGLNSSTGMAGSSMNQGGDGSSRLNSSTDMTGSSMNQGGGDDSSSLNGAWQSDKDTRQRREMIQHIIKMMKKNKNGTPEWLSKLPHMAKQLEVSFYRNARSLEAYMDMSTLKQRLQQIAVELSSKSSSQGGDQRHDRHCQDNPSSSYQQQQQPQQQQPSYSSSNQIQPCPENTRAGSLFMGMPGTSQHQSISNSQRGSQVGNMDQINLMANSGGGSGGGSVMPSMVGGIDPSMNSIINSGMNALGYGGQTASSPTQFSSPTPPTNVVPTRNDPEWVVGIRHKQQRLLLLHHSAKCLQEDGCCTVTTHCAEMKRLWKHMDNCKDNNCRVSHCFSSRAILSHYRKCNDPACPACGPVREIARKARTESASVISRRK